MRAVYGPVETGQLGRVLGVDLVASQRKYCSFDCSYCQSAKRTHGVARRRWFVGLSALQAALEEEVSRGADCVAFSGMGEPTLASNLAEAIDMAKSILGLPVAVCTNSSLMPMEEVRRDLCKADLVVAKLDAPNEELYQRINRPFVPYSHAEILAGLEQFRQRYSGRLALQVTFVEANASCAEEMAAIAARLSPNEVQLNTPLERQLQLSVAEVERLRTNFTDHKTTTVYEAQAAKREPFSLSLPPLRPNAGVMLMAWGS